MPDFFVNNSKTDFTVDPDKSKQINQSSKNYWNDINAKQEERNTEYLEDLQKYSVNIPQEQYNIIKDVIADADNPEDEAYRWASALELNNQYGMPIQQAYENLEQINAALWGDKYKFTPKTNFKAIVDNGKLGINTLKLGRLGSKIMKAEMFGHSDYNNYLAGKTEKLEDMLAEYAAIEQENAGLYDFQDRNFLIESLKFGAQSAPFTAYVAGVGILGGLLSGGVGTAASFAASMDNATGLEYMRLRQAGSDVGNAAGFAILSGGLQAIVETSLGNVAGALGKKSLGDLATDAVKQKITGNVFKRLAYDGTFKTLALRMGKEYLKENAEEGIEEVVQDLIEKGTDALAAEMGGYEIDGVTAHKVAKDAWENFRGGVLGSLVLGLGPSVIKSKAEVKDFLTVRKMAEVIPSQETFNKATDDSIIWEGLSEEEKKEAQKNTWEKAQARVEAAAETEAKKIAEGRDAGEGAEEAPAENEEGITEPNPVARNEAGRLYTSDEVKTDDNGNVTGGTFVIGDKTKSENNRYGYITYSTAENGDITIDTFKMTEGREGLRGEAFDEFAREHPDVKIDWNAIGSETQGFKNELIEANPSGSKNGLSYYSSDELDNIAARKQVADEVRKNIHNVKRNADGSFTRTELSNKQVAAAVTLIESAARRMNMGLDEYVNKTFGNQIFGSREEFEQATLAQGENVNTKAGGMTQGVAQANWREVGQQIKAVIYAGENADFSTWAHEMAHVFQAQLDGDLKSEAEAAFNVVGGDWTRSTYTFSDGRTMSSAEAFAYGFQDWLETGKAESEQMKNIFQKFAEFIADAYNRLRKHLDFTPEIESVFNKLLDGDDTIMSKALKAAQEEEGEYRANLKRQAEEKEAQKKAEAEEAKRQEQAEREEASEGTDFEESAELTPEQAEAQLQEAENETTEENNAIDDALEDLPLTDDKKAEIAEVLKDDTSTVVEKAEAATEAASSVYDEDDEIPNILFQEERDTEYEEAVKAGDTEKAMKMLQEEAERKGYNLGSDYQGTSAFNGTAPYRNGYYSTKEERLEAVKNEEFEDTATLGDYAYDKADPLGFEYLIQDPRSYRFADDKRKEAIDNLRKAVSEARSGKKDVTIKMYRSVPADVEEGSFRNGDWITPSKSYAKDNADVHGWSEGEYRIIEQDVDLEDIWWDGNDIAEWGYDDQKEAVYKNTENNRKLFEITYDKDGSLIPLSKRFDESNPSILYQIAGEIGAQNLDDSEVQEGVSRMQNLAIAKQMETDGKDAKAIRLATGWEKGTDGKWRWEIDDSKVHFDLYSAMEEWDNEHPRYKELLKKFFESELSEEEQEEFDKWVDERNYIQDKHTDLSFAEKLYGKDFRLPEVMNHPELFKAYPELKDVTVSIREQNSPAKGDANYEDKHINLYRAKEDTGSFEEWEKEAGSVLLHEVQHIIQGIEGFAKGANPELFTPGMDPTPLTKALASYSGYTKEELEGFTAEKEIAKFKDAGMTDEEIAEISPDVEGMGTIEQIIERDIKDYGIDWVYDAIQSAQKEVDNAGKIIVNGKTFMTDIEAYRATAGEVESRNVQARMNFTPKERREALLAATEDVARDDQIMLFQTVYHGSGADFDKFDTENFGLSGEGSMSFGYGTYVTDSEEIARDYAERQKREKISRKSVLERTIESDKELYEKGEKYLKQLLSDLEDVRKRDAEIREKYGENSVEYQNFLFYEEEKTIQEQYERALKSHEERKRYITENEKELSEISPTGKLYTVEIPDDGYLEFDKKAGKKIVKKIAEELEKRGYKYPLRVPDYLNNAPFTDKILYGISHDVGNIGTNSGTYADLYELIGDILAPSENRNTENKKASAFLHSIGYVGIKYPAGTIHGNGNGAYNYVIFNDDDAKIVDKLLFQTNAELMDEARTFDSWQEFMDYCEAFHADDEVSPIPSDADAQWYQTFYETSNGVKTEQEKNEETVEAKNKKEGALPVAVDALFTTMIRSDPQMVDSFLQAVAELDAIDLDSEEWLQAESAEDAAQREQIEKLKDFIGITLSDYNWQTALRRIQGGHEISEGLRKRLIGEMTDSFKARDFRALYAEVMNDEQYAVAPEDSITAVLNKKLKKYHDIVKPNDDISRWSPERRKQLAEQLQNRELADKIRRGDLKLDDELDAYIKSLNKQIKEKQKQFDELEAETKADYQRIADAERKKLLKVHDELLLLSGRLQKRDHETARRIKTGLKITEKYQKISQNLKADYDEVYRKYQDLLSSIQITAEVREILDRQNRLATLVGPLDELQKERNITNEIKKMRLQLVKKTMRRVPFDRVDYENAKTIIAIQRILEPNLLGGVNRFIGVDSPFLRGVISQILTDNDFREKIQSYLRKNSRSSQAFADFKKKLEELKTIKDFDNWTAKDRKAAIRYLPKENWVRDLNLRELAKEREESIDIDIGMEEVKRTVYDEKTGEPKTYKDKEGNEHNVTETAFRVKFSDEIARLVQNAVGADIYDKLVNVPFAEWTTEDLEGLAQRIDELYTEGCDLKAAKDEARKKEAAAIRKRIEDAIKETGITFNDDDTPEERERKQKQIDKILGMSSDLKGTEAAKDKGFIAKITRLLHSYSDMNVMRFARMLDGQSEGENYRMLYRKEDDCYNAKQRSMASRASTVNKVMADNKITEADLAKIVKVPQLGTEFTVDELLYFLAADKDYVEDEKKLQRGLMGLDANDDFAATSRNAVMFGNMMSDMMSQEEKEAWNQLDKDLEDALKNDTLTQEQKEQQAAGTLDKKPGTTRYIMACHAKWEVVLGVANNYLSTHPEYKALMEAIEADYASQYERMNEVSITEFNQPVHRVKAYVPLVRRESNGDTNEAQVKEDLLGANGVGKQWADKGMTQRRVQISPLNQKPVQTGLFRTWGDSIERTEHFIAYAPYVRQLNAIYKSRDASYTRRFIESRYGKGAIEYLDSYINEVANPNAGRIRERGAEWLHILRGKTAPAYLGWKASGIIKQGLTSPWPYMQFVNPAEYLSAAMKFTFNPEMREAISEKSIYMKMRRMDPVNDLIDEMADNAKSKLDRGWSKFSQMGMQGLEFIDWACVAPGWLACYEKKYNQLQKASEARYNAKMEELKERNMYADVGTSEYLSPQQMEAEAKKEITEDIETEAVRYADDCTRACQPSNRVTDLAPLFKNSSEAMKAFLQFQTSLNVIWQNIRYDMPYAWRQRAFKRIAGTVIGYVMAGIFMNSVMDGLRGDDDDDETQALRNLIYYSTTQFTDAIPIMGSEITNAMDKILTGKRAYSQSGTDMTPSATKLLNALQKARSGDFKKAAALTAEGIGLFMGAPVSGVKEINKLLGKPLTNGDVDLLRGLSDVYGIAGDILEE